ncbi:MAG: amidohydrolase family protein, partial [Pseudomonadota bacterium]
AWEPNISPDGKQVVYKAYRDGSFDLWMLNLTDTGAPPIKLTDTAYDDREPQYAPDGTRIIFSSDRSGSYDIWQLDLVSSTISRLTQTVVEAHSPCWAPDGRRFAYVVSDRSGSKIFIQQPDAKTPQQVFSASTQVTGLQWLPGGREISYRALDRDAAGNAYTTLRVIGLETESSRDISPPGMDVFPFRANWLDSGTVVFSADGKVQILEIGAEPTTEEFEIHVALDRTPYAKKRTDFDSTTKRSVLGISYPTISPDGDRVAFGALGDLWLWSPAVPHLVQLTDDPAADQTPSWSADGKRLAYISDRDGQPRIQVLDLATDKRTTLMLDHKELSFPSWSPDGRQLAYFTDVPGNPLLHVVGQLTVYDLNTETSKTYLAPMPPQPINWSADGGHLLTTRLYPYSNRYREGLYLPVVVNLESGASHSITPWPDRSVTHATLSRDKRLVYVQDGVLNSLRLNDVYRATGSPEVLYNGLADTPSISRSGQQVVFQSGARLMQMDIKSGRVKDITPPLRWRMDQPTEEWILRAGRLFDGVASAYRHNLDIRIRGNRIAGIGPVNPNTQLSVLDASDQVVIPGLFESHAHIGDHNLSEPQGRAWLAYGITSVRDPGSNPYLANERKEAWNSGRRVGPRTFITGHNMDGNRVFYAVVEGISSDAHLERALQRSRELNVDFIKTYVRMSDRHQRRVVEFAHELGIPVTSHELLPAAAYGVDHIEHFTGTSRRGYATKISELGRSYQDVLEVLSVSGMGIVPTMVVPGVVLTFSEQDDLYDTLQFRTFYGKAAKKNYQLFMSFFGPGSEGYVDAYGDLLSQLTARGALVATGTDSPFTPFATGLHAELRLYEREGLKPWQILQAATIQSAKIAHVESDLGSIEVGKLADLVVIEGDPLTRISDLSQISHTIKNGRVYTLDELLKPSHVAADHVP